MYSAKDIARYVIAIFNRKRKPITNLKLQKILYYIQVAFMRKSGEPAFTDEIQAWRHGPVIPAVYYEYNQYVAEPIDLTCNVDDLQIEAKDQETINEIIDQYENTPAWTLVDYTHREYPWNHCYQEGANNPISLEDIRVYLQES
jgi:uncharacterized phage-associated protein